MKKIITLLLSAICLCAYSQVSRFYKDGQWWVSNDPKNAQVQIFRPAKNDSIQSKWLTLDRSVTLTGTGTTITGTISMDTTWHTLYSNSITVPITVAQYRAKCRGNTFSFIADSIYKPSSNSYIITFKDGTSIESNVQCYMDNRYIPSPPWTTDRSFFSRHIMFQFMAACYDDKWLYCPCGAKFPLVKKL